MNTLDTPSPSALTASHLQLHLRKINRVLHAAVAQQKAVASALQRHDVTPLCVSDEQVDQLLQHVGDKLCYLTENTDVCGLNVEEAEREDHLHNLAARQNIKLPLDAMVDDLHLDEFEKNAILLCVAPDLHRDYGRIFAYIHDDLNQKMPTIGLLCSLLARNEEEWLRHRHSLSVYGRLRRLGLVLTQGESGSEQHLACRVAPGVLDRLRGTTNSEGNTISSWRDQFYDVEEIHLDHVDLRSFPQYQQLLDASGALRQDCLNLLAIWGESGAGVESAVHGVAAESGKSLRRLPPRVDAIRNAIAHASYLRAMIWIETDQLSEGDNRELASAVLQHLLSSSVAVVLSGQHPWRPTRLLSQRNYREIRLSPPDEQLRVRNWRRLIPELSSERAHALSHRFRLDPQALLAVERTVRVGMSTCTNGAHADSDDDLDNVCRVVAQAQACRFTKPMVPKRGPDDLVLSDELHRQVLEVARFYKTLGRVNEHWGFGRLATGAGGIKALFAGDSGTGKTLAAEVIAGQIGLPMLKIDLSQLVSKWIGETEKNIDAAFCEAENSHAMLFFDEADTLFGKRGEIQRGSDRYANLEVGYLLQRLEMFPGLAVLASNLKDEIDEAFIRRFQVVLHFPRPGEEERLRLWMMAFPPTAPLESGVDLSRLAHLDMTGAGIFNACHTAALLAANEPSDEICHRHIVEGIARQFHRESRVIGPSDLSGFSQVNTLR